MSSDVGWHVRDKLWPSTETVRLIRTESPGRPPQLSHSSWTLIKSCCQDPSYTSWPYADKTRNLWWHGHILLYMIMLVMYTEQAYYFYNHAKFQRCCLSSVQENAVFCRGREHIISLKCAPEKGRITKKHYMCNLAVTLSKYVELWKNATNSFDFKLHHTTVSMKEWYE